mmetsp:Transcript_8221/g.20168  ORF Transcript_8221/g.20168 Transcript_8221/m.20168 type:complete len:155 (-) Transcript_8221:458-922(-)
MCSSVSVQEHEDQNLLSKSFHINKRRPPWAGRRHPSGQSPSTGTLSARPCTPVSPTYVAFFVVIEPPLPSEPAPGGRGLSFPELAIPPIRLSLARALPLAGTGDGPLRGVALSALSGEPAAFALSTGEVPLSGDAASGDRLPPPVKSTGCVFGE